MIYQTLRIKYQLPLPRLFLAYPAKQGIGVIKGELDVKKYPFTRDTFSFVNT